MGRPQRLVKPAQTARPMEAKQTAGLWTPAASGIAVCTWNHRLNVHDDVLEWDAAAAGFARDTGVRGGRAPRLLLQALLRARAARRSKSDGPAPWGDHKAQRGDFKTSVRVAHTFLVDPE